MASRRLRRLAARLALAAGSSVLAAGALLLAGRLLRPLDAPILSEGAEGTERLVMEPSSGGLRAVRLIALGDSHTYGLGVAPEAAYPLVLQRRLNARGPGRFEVVNAGIPGACIREKSRLYRGRIVAGHRWVLLQLGFDHPRLALHLLEEDGALGWRWRWARRLRRLFPGSALAARAWALALGLESRRVRSLLQAPRGRALMERVQKEFILELRGVAQAARARGARLLVVQIDSGPFRADVRRAAAEAGLAAPIDLEGFESGWGRDVGRTHLPDGHLNAEGYERFVELLLARLPPLLV